MPSPEEDNRLRYPGGAVGHVESHFVKANSPDGTRAFWVKHTLLVPHGRPEAAVAEVWAIAFDARGARKLARKRTFPRAQLEHGDAPFFVRVSAAELSGTRLRGELDDMRWDFELQPTAAAFRPFALDRMYTGGFPRSKSLTPIPDARVEGHVEVLGARWQLAGWRGAQGHNWGVSHAHAYAWAHANAWSTRPGGEALPGVWLEALSGKVRLGPWTTPFLSVAGLAFEGRVYRFDHLRALVSRRVDIDQRSYRFALRQAGVQLEATFRAESGRIAGLRYVDPDGSELACLNSKLASGELVLRDGARVVTLYTEQAALELGTRAQDHGIDILV